MPTESEVRDARAWAARELQKHVERQGGRMTREQAEREVAKHHRLDQQKIGGKKDGE